MQTSLVHRTRKVLMKSWKVRFVYDWKNAWSIAQTHGHRWLLWLCSEMSAVFSSREKCRLIGRKHCYRFHLEKEQGSLSSQKSGYSTRKGHFSVRWSISDNSRNTTKRVAKHFNANSWRVALRSTRLYVSWGAKACPRIRALRPDWQRAARTWTLRWPTV